MSLKSSLLALSENIGMCQENARSIKQALAGGLAGVAANASGIDGATSSKKLWVNANPTSAFAAGNVTVSNADDFDAFIIYYLNFSGSAFNECLIPKSAINDSNNHYIIESNIDTTNGTMFRSRRSFAITQASDATDAVFAFAGGYRDDIATYGSAGTTSSANSNIIPEIIVGVKF